MRRGIWGQGLLGVVAVVLLAGGCSVDEAGLRNDGGGGAAGGGAGGGHAGAAGDGAGGGHAGAAGASATGGGAGAASVPAHFALTRGNVIPPGGASALLPDGRVFVLNGTSAQIFDPATETFTFAGNLITPRYAAAAVLADGRVLVAGGTVVIDNHAQAITDTEIYDFAQGAFVPGPSLIEPRGYPTATTLRDGRVLIVGGGLAPVGSTDRNLFPNTAEVLDAAGTAFTRAGNTSVSYGIHSAVLLADGRVMVAGGNDPRSVGGGQRGEVNLFDPTTNTFRETSRITFGSGTGLVALPDGRALVTGGYYGAEWTNGAIVWEPVNETSTSVGPMLNPRGASGGTVLADGRVMFVSTPEVFDPATNTFSPGPEPTSGAYGAGVLLHDGRVLFTPSILQEAGPATLFVPATP
jgi:hypothetical protein